MAFNWDVILNPSLCSRINSAKNLAAGGSLKPALSEAEGRSLGMARGWPEILTILRRRKR